MPKKDIKYAFIKIILKDIIIFVIISCILYLFSLYKILLLDVLFTPLLLLLTLSISSVILNDISNIISGELKKRLLKASSICLSFLAIFVLLWGLSSSRYELVSRTNIPLLGYTIEHLMKYAPFFIFGYALKSLSSVLEFLLSPVMVGIGDFIVIYGIYVLSRDVLTSLNVNNDALMGLYYAGIALLVMRSLGVLCFSKRKEIFELGKYLQRKALKYSSIAFLAGEYLFIKDFLRSTPIYNYLIFIEMVVGIFVVAIVLDGIYTHFNKDFYVACIEEEWSKHKQKIKFFDEPNIKELNELVRDFMMFGDKERLLAYLAYHLGKLGAPYAELMYVLRPLLEYDEEEVPIIALRITKKRFIRRLFSMRRRVLEELASYLYTDLHRELSVKKEAG